VGTMIISVKGTCVWGVTLLSEDSDRS
jgi:hypothetical protein